jgi:hypothetical protein
LYLELLIQEPRYYLHPCHIIWSSDRTKQKMYLPTSCTWQTFYLKLYLWLHQEFSYLDWVLQTLTIHLIR